MKHLSRWLLALFAAAAPAADPPDAASKDRESEPPLLSLNGGAAEIFDPHPAFCWSAIYRPAWRFHRLGPWILFGSGLDGEYYAAGGVLVDIPLGERWALTPSFGGGYYHSSGDLDLGFDMQFRSCLELAYRFRNRHRLGLAIAHLSNGSLRNDNPGTETLSLVYSIPLDSLFRRRQARPAQD